MSGFAGSERAGERRRRRLAVESDEPVAGLPGTSDGGDPLVHFFENAGREASQLTARNCPVLTVVSAPAWKHWVCVLLGLSAGIGLLVAGYTSPQWAAGHGPGVARLFRSPASPIISWANTLLLFTTAQTAAVVWWARSRSLKDFGGSYRIWGWAAATWLLFSFASTTQAHVAWSETVLFHIRWRTPGALLWCWLLPASAWGWGLALRLEQELRDNRPGHWLFLTAGAWYLGVVGVLCQCEFWPQACPAALSQLLLAVLPLLGHTSLFLSTALHARYVLSNTAEPPLARRKIRSRSAERRSRLGNWLKPAWLFRSRVAVAEEEEDDGKPKRGRKRATAAKKRSAPRKVARTATPDDATEGWDETSEEEWSEEANSGEAADSSNKKYRTDDAEGLDGGHFDDADEGDGLKGLSKRDRRKALQQMREQERRGGR